MTICLLNVAEMFALIAFMAVKIFIVDTMGFSIVLVTIMSWMCIRRTTRVCPHRGSCEYVRVEVKST